MGLFDTHAHLDLPRVGPLAAREALARRARAAGITAILIPGIAPATWSRVLTTAEELAAVTPEVRYHTALGIHPLALADLPPEGDRGLAAALEGALRDPPPSLVAIGECGLDFGAKGQAIPKARQLAILGLHLDAARRHGLPLILHCVRAQGPLFDLLRAAPTPPSILHAFSGSAELARQLAHAGHGISFAATVTDPRARRAREGAASVDLDHLLVESDAPDQAPYARRPAPGEPAFIVDTVRALAALRGLPEATIAAVTTRNARRILGVTGA